jgi:zinc transporter ZupT
LEIWQYLVLFTTVILGGSLAFRFQNLDLKILKLIISFVGAYILGIIVLHLIPEAYQSGEDGSKIGLWVLAGFFIQILLERFSMGVEHGHLHNHHHGSRPMFAFQIMIALSAHAFIEGLPLSHFSEHTTEAHTHIHAHSGNHLFWGVLMHKAPEAFALAVLLLMSNFRKTTVWLCIFLFAAMSPLGALLMSSWQVEENVFARVIALVIGSLLHISTTIIFETDNTDEHSISWRKLFSVLAGVGLALLTL